MERERTRRRRLGLLLALLMAMLTFLVGGLGQERLGQLAAGVADAGARVFNAAVLDVLLGREEPPEAGPVATEAPATEVPVEPAPLARPALFDELVPPAVPRRVVVQSDAVTPRSSAPASGQPQRPNAAAPAGRGQGDLSQLRPVLACVDVTADGTITAVYGYENAGNRSLLVPVGPNNFFDPAPANRSQPTQFAPGRVTRAVTVTAPGRVSWRLGQFSATATPAAPRCTQQAGEDQKRREEQTRRDEEPAREERKRREELARQDEQQAREERKRQEELAREEQKRQEEQAREEDKLAREERKRQEELAREEQKRQEEQAREEEKLAREEQKQAREEQKRRDELAREQHKRREELIREQQKRHVEQAREEQKRQEELAREEQKQAREEDKQG